MMPVVKGLQCPRLIEWMHVGAMHIFDQGQRDGIDIAEVVANQARDRIELDPAACEKPALPDQHLIMAVIARPYDWWRQ